MPLQKNQKIMLKISGISSDGNGVGRHEGQVVFVPFAAIGDEAEIKIVKTGKTHAYGRLENVLKPGEGRIAPDCPVFGQCGGCSFRHLRYEAELATKEGFVRDALGRIGKLSVHVAPIVPSPLANRYRGKVQYPVGGKNGALIYGFYSGRSHRLVPCADCLLQPEILNRIAHKLAEVLRDEGVTAYDEATRTGLLRHICLRRGHEGGNVLLTLVLNGNSLPDNNAFVERISGDFPEISGVVLNRNTKNTNVIFGPVFTTIFGEGTLRDTFACVPQRLGPASFSQVNHEGAEALFALAAKLASLQPGEKLLDLYCGAGVIGLALAKGGAQLVGVELDEDMVKSARESAAEMGLTNARFLCADAGQAAKTLLGEGFAPDVAVLDPPRKGCGPEALRPVIEMAPSRIVMVSCNPATLARDLATLTENGYRAHTAHPVDLFPRTRHVECVVLMEHI